MKIDRVYSVIMNFSENISKTLKFKSPLRWLIVIEDFFFGTTDELCEKMKRVFADDVEKDEKYYKLIPISDL